MKRTIIILLVASLILIALNGCDQNKDIKLEDITCGPSIVEGRAENCYVNADYTKTSDQTIECNVKVSGSYLPDARYIKSPSGNFNAWIWEDTINYPHKVELCCQQICESCNVNPMCK